MRVDLLRSVCLTLGSRGGSARTALLLATRIFDLPSDLLQVTIDTAIEHTDWQSALGLREIRRALPPSQRFNGPSNTPQTTSKRSYKSESSAYQRLCFSRCVCARLMTHGLILSKMLLGNADELHLCSTLNRTAEYFLTEALRLCSPRLCPGTGTCRLSRYRQRMH